MVFVKTHMEVEIPECGKKCRKCRNISERQMGLGFNLCVVPSPKNQVSQILDGVEKNLEKEWTEGVQTDYRIPV